MKTSFYTLAWRWHFYAGLFVAPFMILLALTGIVYLFKPQLDPWMYRDLMQVTPQAATLSADQQKRDLVAAYPNTTVSKYLPPESPERSAQFVVQKEGRETNVFIDPYSGKVLGEQDAKRNLQAIARALHGEIMIGTVGDRLIELAAGWGIVLVVSGLYLWWPRGAGFAGVLWPRLASGGRLVWRDLHAVVGFWGSLVLLLMLLSGMTWTGFWGNQFSGVWNRFPEAMWNSVPKSDQLARSLNTAAVQTVPWAVENTPVPVSDEHAAHAAAASDDMAGMDMPGAKKAPVADTAQPNISLQQVVDIASARHVQPGYSITLPTKADGVFTLAVFADDPRNDATLHVDQYTGKVLADVRWQDYGLVARATELGVMLHEGKLYGLVNQLIVLGICLLVLLSAVSGLVIWWKRRPVGGLGVPPLRHGLPAWKTGVAIMLVLAVAFPLVGLSLVVVAVFDQLIARLPLGYGRPSAG